MTAGVFSFSSPSIPEIVLVGDTSARTNYWSQTGQAYNATSGNAIFIQTGYTGYYRDIVNKFVNTPQGKFFLVDTGNNSTACLLAKTTDFKTFTRVTGSTLDIVSGVLFYYASKLYAVGQCASDLPSIVLYESSDYGTTWTLNDTVYTGSGQCEVRGGADTVDNVIIITHNTAGGSPDKMHAIAKSSLAVTTTTITEPIATYNIIRNFGSGAGSNKVRIIGEGYYIDSSSSGVLTPTSFTLPTYYESIDYNASIGKYVAFGRNGATGRAIAYYSTNLSTWTACTVPTVSIAANGEYQITATRNGFVASYVQGTTRGIWYSSDGITFTSLSTTLYGFATTTRME
jgi:hypothetical protein